jgi:hypothetical protein
MTDVPSNLIPTRITQLPLAPVADENSLMMIVYQGNNYQIRVGDLLSVAGVPTTRQVIAGTGMTGGGQLSSNVTLSIAPGGVGSAELANSGVTPGVYGTSTNIPVFTVDATGRVMAATAVPATISGYVPDTRQVIAGTGLSGGGALTSNVTLTANLSNVTPQLGNNAGSAGVSNEISRADHVHPAVDLSDQAQINGILPMDQGGTARSLVPDEGGIIWSGADGLYIGPPGAYGQVLVSNGQSEYLWANVDVDIPQPANTVRAGPVSGADAVPTFRSLVTDDLPLSGVTAASYGTASSVPTISVNSKGQVTSAVNTSIAISASQISSGTVPIVQGGTGATDAATALSNLGGVPTTRQVAAGTGLTGGGNLSADRTFSLANTTVVAGNYGSATQVGAFTVDAQGRLTAASSITVTPAFASITSRPTTLAGYGITDAQPLDPELTAIAGLATNGLIVRTSSTTAAARSVAAGTGISVTNGDGVSGNPTVALANTAVTPATYGSSSQVGAFTVDAQGRLTTASNVSIAIDATAVTSGTLPVVRGGTGVATLTGYAKGNGSSAFTGVTSIPNADLQNSGLTIGSTSVALGGTASTISGLTTLTLTQNPVNPLEAATKQYVDAAVEGLNVHAPAAAATTVNLTATYNNGTGGVGATLTNAGVQAAFAVDGYTAILSDRILVKNQSTAAQNGVYTVTTLGSGSTNWVLTRAVDMDDVGTGADQLAPGDYVFVSSGTQNGGTAWVVTTPLPITIGTTPITFVQFAGPGTYTAGAGLTLTGTQFSITSTGVTAASYGTASSVPTIAVDARGQITSASNTAIAIAASQVTSGILSAVRGGTGLGSFTQGDLLYASSSTTLAALSDVAAGNALLSGGVGADPAWGKIDLATHVSGTLPVANGGSGLATTPTNGQLLIGNGTNYTLATLTAGSGIAVTNGAGSISISATGGGGTVTSVNASGGTTGLTFSGGPITGSGTLTLGGTLAVASGGTNSAATPTAGAIAYGTGTAYAFSSAGSSGQVLLSGGVAAPAWSAQSSLAVGTATNLAGGTASQIPYQTGAGATAFIANGTSGQVLRSNGTSAPSWAAIDGGSF